jgi:ureidoglycolate lyase
MRIAMVHTGEKYESCVAHGETWVPARDLLPAATSLAAALQHTAGLREALGAVPAGARTVPAGEAVLGPCVERTAKCLAVGLNYLDHIDEVGAGRPAVPYAFFKTPNTPTGPYAPVTVPRAVTGQLDHEVELAVVLGRRVRDADAAEAAAAVAGYAVANDLSARDWQRPEPWPHWVRAKCLDGFLPLGPWVTTADEAPDPGALELRCWVNGELRQSAKGDQMVFPPAEVVAFLSQGLTLEPGDVILTGTPSGSAFARPDTPWLVPGDRVRCEITSLGHVENELR